MTKRIGCFLGLAIIAVLVFNLAGCRQAPSATNGQAGATYAIKDMSGRSVTIPDDVKRILAVHPVATYLLYRLAPDKLVSVDTLFHSEYFDANGLHCYSDADLKKLKSLPVTGVFFQGVDPEQIITLNPDVVITIVRHPKLDQFASQIGIPVVTFAKDSLPLYEPSIRMIGKIVQETRRMPTSWPITGTIPCRR